QLSSEESGRRTDECCYSGVELGLAGLQLGEIGCVPDRIDAAEGGVRQPAQLDVVGHQTHPERSTLGDSAQSVGVGTCLLQIDRCLVPPAAAEPCGDNPAFEIGYCGGESTAGRQPLLPEPLAPRSDRRTLGSTSLEQVPAER